MARSRSPAATGVDTVDASVGPLREVVLIRVALSGRVFGLLVVDGVVVEAAPIARWTVGRKARWVWDYFVARDATVTWHP